MRTIRNCNVCVVGGAGFLGSHLVDHLIEDRQCNVLVIDNLEVGKVEFIHPKAKFYHHDITGSEDVLHNLFKVSQIKYVFNYAARPYVPDSYDRPLRTFDVNTMGALKVINAAQQAGVEAILQVSSAELYGSQYNRSSGVSEETKVEPHSTYGSAKAAIDSLIQVRWKEAQTPCIALRQFNCVGERETHPYVIPEIISQLHQFNSYKEHTEVPTVKLGNNSRRDFMYAGDAVRSAVELLENGQFGEVYNLGSEESIAIYDLAKLIGEIMGYSSIMIKEDESRKRKWEIWNLTSDNTKIYYLIKYRPTVTLRQALERTIYWFNLNGYKWAWER